MADKKKAPTNIDAESDKSLRREQDSKAAEQAEQVNQDAKALDAEEFLQSGPDYGFEEQPIGTREDEIAYYDRPDGEGGQHQDFTDSGSSDAAQEETAGTVFSPDSGSPQEGTGGRGGSAVGAGGGGATFPERNINADEGSVRIERPIPSEPIEPSTVPPTETGGEPTGPTPPTSGTQQNVLVPEAQAPSLNVAPATGFEDSPIPLDISSALQDSDGGSEVLSIQISGVPNGAVLSNGTPLGNGIWVLTPAELSGLTITPPPDSNVDFTLTVTATSTESNGDIATISAQLPVNVIGVADTPLLQAQLASGDEDIAANFTIDGALTDTDGSETLTYLISNVPSGATLSAGTDNGDGTWTLTADQVQGLQFTPPLHFSGSVSMLVTAIATEDDGDVARASTTVTAVYDPVADTPNASVEDVKGFEDTQIPLKLSASLVDQDGSETLTTVIEGVPSGAILSSGTDLGGGRWEVSPADLGSITILPPNDFSGDIPLTLVATSTEPDGSQAVSSNPFNVHVTGVADTPDLTVVPAGGTEDIVTPLSITSALNDLDGSETLELTIAGVPNGFTLSAGTDNGNGTWTLAPADLTGLSLTAPQDFSGNFDLTVTATATEADGDVATNVATLPVQIAAVADIPDVTAQDVNGTEDIALPLQLTAAATDIDGSESITQVVISGVPNGFTFNAGTDLGGGQWSIPPAQLSTLTLSAPQHYSGSVTLTVEATATDTGGVTATSSANFTASFAPVPDVPNVGATNVTGDEDTAIPLTLSSSLVDTDGSETLSLVITGVPSNATLSSGTDLGGGQWQVDAADLGSLTITPGLHFSGDIPLTLVATATESDGTTATNSAPFNVHVVGVADTPGLTASLSPVDEDQNMPLNITGTLVDTDGSETLSYEVSGIPNGFTLTAGTDQGGGVYSLTPAELANLELVPPANFSGDVLLTVSVTTTEADGDTATVSTPVSGTFGGVADPPSTSVSNVSGDEDTQIPLALSAALTDTDGSETLTTVITGVPTGATLSSGTNLGNGKWSVDPADLATLEVTPPLHFSGTINMTLEATSTEATGDSTTVTNPFIVTVAPIPDAPNLATPPIVGNEDIPLDLNITSSLVDTDGSETLSLRIEGVPNGFTLSAGTDLGGGEWSLTPAQLNGLTMSMPQDYKGTFNLTVTATATEPDGSTADTQNIVPVTVNAVADIPALTVTPASTLEDNSVPLDISTATTDITGSESISKIIITGVPTGTTLSAGTEVSAGQWELTPAELTGLTLSPTPDSNVDFTLTVTSIAVEPNGSTAQNVASLPVSILGDADLPGIATSDASGNEDTWIPLTISGNLTDVDGSETLSFIVDGLPNGAQLNLGTQQPDGSWTISAGDIGNLSIRPPGNFSGTFDITATSVATENDGDVATNSAPITVTVDAVADRPRVVARNVNGVEDNDLALNLSANVRDPSEEIQSAVIRNVPSGFTVINGTDLGGGVWEVPADQLGTIELSPPQDFSGTVNLQFRVTTVEPSNGDTAVRSRNFSASFRAVADQPTVTVQDEVTDEDTAVALNLDSQLTDVDGSESLTLVISGVPNGAVLSAGVDNGNGTWTIDPADLGSLSFTPPLNFSGDIPLTLEATSTEASNQDAATNSATFNIHVVGVADTPGLVALDAHGNEDAAIPLTIRANLFDTDGSESLFVEFSNVPAGASFSAGTQLPNGNWRVPAADLSNLTITPPEHSNVDFTINVQALSVESDGDQAYSAPLPISISLRGVPDAPVIISNSTVGDEDTAIPVNFEVASGDTDGSETLSYVIYDLPNGASINVGTFIGNGKYSLTPSELQSLTITPPQDFAGNFDVSFDVVVQEDDGRQSTFSYTHPVEVTPVIDGIRPYPTARGLEDTAINLNVDPASRDSDGSETTEWVEISNIPTGAILSAGTETSPGSGVFRLTPAEFSGLTITPPPDSGDDFTLQVSSLIQEQDGSQEVRSGTLRVVVEADADIPNVSAQDITGPVGTDIPAQIASSLNDIDGSESLKLIIGGLAGTGIIPTEGLNLGGGNWLIDASSLPTLAFHDQGGGPDTDVPVTVTAISTETEGDQATNTATFTITTTPGGGGGGPGGPPVTPPTVTVTPPPTGDEDLDFPVGVSVDFGTDGSQYAVIISDLPPGASPNIGFYDPINDRWIIDGSNTAVLNNLEITPPPDFSGTFDFTISAVKTGNNGNTLIDSQTVTADIDPIVDTPNITLGTTNGTEDTPFNIDLNINPTDIDGSESVTSATISNLPSGATLSGTGVTDLGNGTYEVNLANINDIQFTPPPNGHGNFNFTVDAVISDSGTVTGSFSQNVGVNIAAVTDPAILTATDATGDEDTAIALTLDAQLVDTDGSEVMSTTITGVPSGALFSAGSNNGDGSWTFTQAQLSGLTFTPPPNANGDINMELTAFTMETSTGQVVTTTAPFTVSVTGVADTLIVDSQDSTGAEDTVIPMTLGFTQTDTDGSETVTAVLTGIPAGSTLSSGTQQPDGSWLVDGNDLATLTITPPLHFSGDINVHADITTTETDGDSLTEGTDFTVTVTPVADAPQLSTTPATGDEDTPINLDIQAALTDPSEVLTVSIAGVPAGATLSAGTQNPDGTWSVDPADLAGLTVTPPTNDNSDFTLTITATSEEPQTGETQQTVATLDVDVQGVADPVTITATDTTGDEESSIPITASFAYQDTDGSETVTAITVSGVPVGATLSAGTQNPDGTWTVDPADLSSLTITPAQNFSGDIPLTLDFLNEENDGDTSVTSENVTVTVTPVADAPTLTVQPASGDEDTPIALDIQPALTDSGETLSVVVVDNVPSGSTFSAGTQNPDGSWTFTPAELSGLTFTPPPEASGTFNLNVTAVSTEPDNNDTAQTSEQLTVTVDPVADTPVLSTSPASGDEDTAIPLDIQASSPDSGETISVTIDGIPSGATLSAGTDNMDGSWTLDAGDLAGLTLTPEPDFSGNITLNVTATSTDGTDQAVSTSSLVVDVEGQPDAPAFTVQDSNGTQDTPIALDIQAQTTAPGETLSVTIDSVPTGATLNAGTDNMDGSWTLDPADLSGLEITPPASFTGVINLGVTATVEQDGNTLDVTDSLDVTVSAPPAPFSFAAAPYMAIMASDAEEEPPIEASQEVAEYMDSLPVEEDENDPNEVLVAQQLDTNLNGAGSIGSDLDTMTQDEGQQQPDDLGGETPKTQGKEALPEPGPEAPNADSEITADTSTGEDEQQ